MCEKLAGAGVDMIEVNISCPNVKAGGLAYGTRPELAAEVAQMAKSHAGKVPVMVKLSPNVTDITLIARAVEEAGADAVSLINTLRGMRIDVNTRRPILKMNTGGLSGPAVLPVAVRMVWEVAQAVKIPILGMGGVSRGEDAAQLMLAGASAVAVGTALFADPYAPIKVRDELGQIAQRQGLTLNPREGNPAPRIAETPMGILNSVGLQNPGVDAFIAHELPFLRNFDVKVIANISGNTPEEYGIMCEKLAGAGVDMIEVNISCPNVKAGGLAYGTRPELAAEVTQMAKSHAGKVPVMVKLSPNVTDITLSAKAVADAGADAVSLINTLRGMRIDVNTHRPILKMNTGGLSGPAVLPVAVRMVWEVAQAVDIPILGMGGVSRGEDAAQLMLAGATAVAVGTALFADPYAPIKVRDELGQIAQRQGLTAVKELTGQVKPW